ncbi:MAG: hypothetical protein E7300_00815 [Lachnospiraceae bacterium]|nr:hypothetical protein [Lachnospiraceae bacterium]
MRNKFSVKDYKGRTVNCTADTWYGHLANSDHAIMYGNEGSVKNTIADPDVVYQSNQFESREVFFKNDKNANYTPLYTKVVVEYSDNVGDVVTTFPVKAEKGGIGDVIYRKDAD